MCDSSCGNPTCRGTPTESPTAKKARKGLGRFGRRSFSFWLLEFVYYCKWKWNPHQKKMTIPKDCVRTCLEIKRFLNILGCFFKLYMGETWWNWGWLSVIFFQRRRHHPAIGGPPDNSSESWHRRFTASRVVINGTLWESNTAMENPWKSTGNEGLMRV